MSYELIAVSYELIQGAMERRQFGDIGTRVAGRKDKDCRQVASGPIGTPPTWWHR